MKKNIDINVYGFGLLEHGPFKPIELIKGVHEGWVCEIVGLDSIDNYNRYYEGVEKNFLKCKEYIGGNTPLNKALKVVDQEFHRLTESKHYKKPFLILVSDGCQTDSTDIECIISSTMIKNSGAIVLSCFLSDHDIYTNNRTMYGRIRYDWRNEVQLMWKYASTPLELREKLLLVEDQLKEMGWNFEENYKLFVQLNSEEIFKEFLHILEMNI